MYTPTSSRTGSSASLHPGTPSVAYLQPLSRSASYSQTSSKKMPSRPALKSNNTWAGTGTTSSVGSTCIPIFISLVSLTHWHHRFLIPHTITCYVPPTIQPPHASSLCQFTSSSCTHPVRRGPDPVSPNCFGLYDPFSGPGTYPCPACHRSADRGSRSTRSQISQVPLDDRRESRLSFSIEQEDQTLQLSFLRHGHCHHQSGCTLCDPHDAPCSCYPRGVGSPG